MRVCLRVCMRACVCVDVKRSWWGLPSVKTVLRLMGKSVSSFPGGGRWCDGVGECSNTVAHSRGGA